MSDSESASVPSPPPSTDTRLTGDELLVTAEMAAQVFWALKKYSSLVYGRRLLELYKRFVSGLEEWTATLTDELSFERETLGRLYKYQGYCENGLQDLARGRKRTGYQALYEGSEAFPYINGRRFEGIYWKDVGWRGWDEPAVGVFSWAERGTYLANRIRTTLESAWTYEKIFGLARNTRLAERSFPSTLPSAPAAMNRPKIRTGDPVPFTGIWVPTSFPGGCPNFLVEGWRAPQATRTHLRRDRPAFQLADGTWAEAFTDFYDEEVPAEWLPAWRDDRYGFRTDPDPPEYLGEFEAFPPHPPHFTPSRDAKDDEGG